MQYILTEEEYNRREYLFKAENHDKYILFLQTVSKLSESSDIPLEFKAKFASWIEQARMLTISQ